MSAKITFYGGVGSVTGANFLCEFGSSCFLVDCGLIQGDEFAMKDNRKDFEYDPASIQKLFVTHAHLDHVGRIPKLVKDGFRGEIYSTPETKALATLILEDAVEILDKEAREDGILPIYDTQDVVMAISLWKTIPYHTETTFGDLSVYLKDAGHILGSSMIQFTYENKKVVFTGDLGNTPTELLRDTESIEGANYVVMESVYGDRNHEPKDERRKKLKKVIEDTVNRGGTLVIPAFSLERTQVIIYEINKLVEAKEISSIPVYIDSPLATKITEIYKNSIELFNDKAKAEIKSGDDLFNFPRLLFTASTQESREIDHFNHSKIIIAGSGMSVGGRVRHHEEVYLPDPKSTILLVGYQTLGTTGRQLLNGAKKIKIDKRDIKVKAHIESIMGFSSHKDSDNLVEFVSTAGGKLQKVFVVMGELKSSTFLAQRINDELSVQAICPERAVEYEIK